MSKSCGCSMKVRHEKTHIKVGSSTDSYHNHQPLRMIREDGNGSEPEDEDIGGKFSKLRIGGGGRDRTSSRASQSTIRGPRIQEITDADVDRISSRYGGGGGSSRQSTSRQPTSRTSGTTELRIPTSRPTTDRIPTSRAIEYVAHSSKPSESRRGSIRPSESRHPGTSSRRNTVTSGYGSERTVYADRDSRGGGGTARYEREPQSSRRESRVKSGVKALVKYM